jgi:hypothetical protein
MSERLAYDPPTTFCKRKQALSQMSEVRLDRKAVDRSTFPTIAIPVLGAWAVVPEELMLDVDREIAGLARIVIFVFWTSVSSLTTIRGTRL